MIAFVRSTNRKLSTGVIEIQRLQWRWMSSPGVRADDSDTKTTETLQRVHPALVALEQAQLGYTSTSQTQPIDLKISYPKQGGHILLGRNGTGKTLVSTVLTGNNSYIRQGSYITPDKWYPDYSTAQVSFESHEALLEQGGTAYKAISGGGNLTKAAQFLVVRFGLYPLLHRDVDTLSTGEIRKVLLVRALAHRPKLLVLDNAFDGLDVPSRKALADLVSKTLRGFRQDILVQSVDSRATEHTQVLLMTHRAEEIVDEFATMSYFDGDNESVVTEERSDRSGEELFERALDIPSSEMSGLGLTTIDWSSTNSTSLPEKDEISSWWNLARGDVESPSDSHNSDMVKATNLCIRRGDATLLENLSWTVSPGDRWLVAGGNGAGKSTLSRFLARKEEEFDGDFEVVKIHPSSNLKAGDQRPGIGWVSTELHMATSRSDRQVCDVVTNNGALQDEIAMFITSALGIDEALFNQAFSKLSQGEQKLVLIASALAERPQLLVLDEPCQGLDLLNRKLVLGLVEQICEATDISLIYITHHLEELIPSVTHVLHLAEGKAVYNGTRDEYDPNAL